MYSYRMVAVPTVSYTHLDVYKRQIYISVKIFENGKVVIRIRDKGCGIEDVEKAKEPLYSTGGEERAGLGFMAVSYTHLDVYKRQ